MPVIKEIKKLILTSFCLAPLLTFSQTPDLIPYRKGYKWGFCDRDKKIIVAPKYDTVLFFSNRYARVRLKDNWGIIDKTGKEIIPVLYGISFDFSDGLIPVKLNNKCEVLDTTGDQVIPFLYDYISNFSKGLAVAQNQGKYGLIDRTGKAIVPLKYDNICNCFSSERFIGVQLNSKWGFIDINGKEVAPFIYDEMIYWTFGEGFVCVKRDSKWGFIDTTGKEVLAPVFEDYSWFSKGVTQVKRNGKKGFIDKSGKEIIPFIYDDIFPRTFQEGLICVKSNNKWGFIDSTGKEILSPAYDEYGSFSEGLAGIMLNNKKGFIDKTGKPVIPFEFDYTNSFYKGLSLVGKNHKYGVIDRSGKEVVPIIYEDASSFSEGLASVKMNNKWGFVNTNGKEVIALKYDRASGFSNGLSQVFLNSLMGYIGKNGVEYWQDPSAEEDFAQYLTLLQKKPNDYALREKIISLGGTMKPKPAVPADAERYMIRGRTALELGKASKDYKEAISEFRKAVDIAPWLGSTYFNLAVVEELATDYRAALRHFKYYLLAEPDAADAKEVQTKIYELEFKNEKKIAEEKRKQICRNAYAKIKTAVNGRSYRFLICSYYLPACETCENGGCNYWEAQDKNWRSFPPYIAVARFKFPDENTIQLVNSSTGAVLFEGRPDLNYDYSLHDASKDWGDVAEFNQFNWFCSKDNNKPVFATLWKNGAVVRFSCDAPVKITDQDIRYHYLDYRDIKEFPPPK